MVERGIISETVPRCLQSTECTHGSRGRKLHESTDSFMTHCQSGKSLDSGMFKTQWEFQMHDVTKTHVVHQIDTSYRNADQSQTCTISTLKAVKISLTHDTNHTVRQISSLWQCARAWSVQKDKFKDCSVTIMNERESDIPHIYQFFDDSVD